MVKHMKTTNGRSITSNRVLVVDNQGIMGAGLVNLISGDPTFDVLGVTNTNEEILVQEIWQIQPDIIILILESEGISPCRLLDLLEGYGRLRIILVSVDNNDIGVYDRQHTITQNQDSLISKLRL